MDVSDVMGFIGLVCPAETLAATGPSSGQIALILVIVGVTATLAMTARRRRARDANSPRAYVREQITRLRDEAQIKDDVDALLVQVQDITRRMNAQLDTKFHKLERTIRDADERIAGLDRLMRLADGQPVCDVTVGDADDKSPVPPREHDAAAADRPHARVHQLADAGLTAAQIAEETRRPKGEIDLILALRPKSETPAPR